MHADEADLTDELVRLLLDSQMPAYAELPLTVVEPWGTDNGIWRLGDEFVVRLPRIGRAMYQLDLEAMWLPRLRHHLPITIPQPVAVGAPGHGYPYQWAVHRWVPGEPASYDRMTRPERFAADLATVVRALQAAPAEGAPPAHNRARPLCEYDDSTRAAIEQASSLIDADLALEVWEGALAARPHSGAPVWVHGDLEGNCLLTDGGLSGIVDWGLACAGDPAVDVQVVWSPLFDDRSRALFVDALEVDDDTLARSRGAAINQACAALPYYLDTYPLIVERSWHKLTQLGVGPRDAH
jgi:aminoglycoside phosphotransferase (APT) family kinase protein